MMGNFPCIKQQWWSFVQTKLLHIKKSSIFMSPYIKLSPKKGYCKIFQSKTNCNYFQWLDNIFEDEKREIKLCHDDTGRSCFSLHVTR